MLKMTVERWCSMKEVCEHLGASHDSVVHWVKNNNLPAVKIGRLWRFKMSEATNISWDARTFPSATTPWRIPQL